MERSIDRRTLLAVPAMAALGASTAACAQEAGDKGRIGSSTLVAYVSRSGNTRVIAETLQRTLGAELFEILPARPYPEDYEDNVEQARQERDRGIEPPLKTSVGNMASYETIYLGFPVWGETTPPVIRSFLRRHDLSRKTIRPFITHGGFGVGNSLKVLSSHAPSARIECPFILEGDQERRTIEKVMGWLTDRSN